MHVCVLSAYLHHTAPSCTSQAVGLVTTICRFTHVYLQFITVNAPQSPACARNICRRHPLLDVVHDLVKPELIEELGQLLVLVAKEEADKHQTQQQTHTEQTQQQHQQRKHAQHTQHVQQEQHKTDAAASKANGMLAVKQEQDVNGIVLAQPTAVAKSPPEGRQSATADSTAAQPESRSMLGAESAPGHTPAGKAEDADGDSVMHEAATREQEQAGAGVDSHLVNSQPSVSDAYAAQEAVVLQEFNAILQRIVAQAEKKSSSMAAEAVTTAPTPAHMTGVSTASTELLEQQSQQQQQQQQSVQHLLQLQQQPLQQQLIHQQQAQQSRSMVSGTLVITPALLTEHQSSDCVYSIFVASV